MFTVEATATTKSNEYQKSSVDQLIPQIILILIVIYLWGTWPYTKLKRLKIKGPSPWPFLGNYATIFTKGYAVADLEWSKKFGKIFGIYEGRNPVIIIKDLDIVKEILIKDFSFFPNRENFYLMTELQQQGIYTLRNEKWKEMRKILTPAFSSRKLREIFPRLKDCCEGLNKRLLEMADRKIDVNIKEYINAFTLDVIAITHFGIQINSQQDINNPLVKNAKIILRDDTYKISQFVISLFPFLISLMEKLKITTASKPSSEFYTQIKKLVKENRQCIQDQNSILHYLLKTHLNVDEKLTDSTFGSVRVRELTDEEITTQLYTFFVSEFETTAATLSFAIYLLATWPDWQKKIIKEAEEVIKKFNNELTYEAILEMTVVEMVLNETLRLYPPTKRISRTASRAYKIGKTTIPEGMQISIPIYAIHHDEKFWSNPEEFNPERFTAKSRAQSHPASFLPYGLGPRSCIGTGFAIMEIKLILIYLLQNLKFSRDTKVKVPKDLKNSQLASAKHELLVKVERRY